MLRSVNSMGIGNMTKTLVLALVALLSATGAAASVPAQQAAEEEEKICKTERVTGSRTRTQRICLTEAQWRELAASTKNSIDRYSQNVTSRRDGAGQAQ